MAQPHAGKKRVQRQASEVNVIDVRKETSLVLAEGHEETVSDRINAIGFGAYQVHCIVACSGFIIAEGAELAMGSGLIEAVGEDLGMTTDLEKSTLMTAVFGGLAIGTILSGYITDPLGRRPAMLIGSIGVASMAGIVACVPPSPLLIYILRFALGVFAGIGIPVSFITLAEVCPTNLRGICTAAMGMAFTLGELWAGIGLLLFMPQLDRGPWRNMVLWAAQPAVALLIFGCASPVSRSDSAHWLAIKGRGEDLVDCINLMAEMNGRPDLMLEVGESLYAEKDEAVDRAAAHQTLFEWPMSCYTICLALLFFAKDFAFYGMNVFWPLAWANFRGLALPPAAELMCTSAMGIPGVLIAMKMMHALPRRTALASSATLCAVAAMCLTTLEAGSNVGLLGAAVFKLSFPGWQMVTMLLPSELYPTSIKGVAYSYVAVFGRIATIIAPLVVGASHCGFLFASLAAACMAACAALRLPETKDCRFVNMVENEPAVVKPAKGYGAVGV